MRRPPSLGRLLTLAAATAALPACVQKRGPEDPARLAAVGADAAAVPHHPELAGLWRDATRSTIGAAPGWGQGVELADLNDDGRVDVILVNGKPAGAGAGAGAAPASRVFLNDGPGRPFKDATTAVLGKTPVYARVLRARDLTGDGCPDLLIGGAYGAPTRLLVGDCHGHFTDVTRTSLPAAPAGAAPTVVDVAVGDVDGDGSPDLVLLTEGARPRLWLNDGAGHFTDATATHLPDVAPAAASAAVLVDVDDDASLDLLVTGGAESFYLHNDGTGHFSNWSPKLPALAGSRAVVAVDLRGTGSLDLVAVGDRSGTKILLNDHHGGFAAAPADVLPDAENLATDDRAAVALGAASEGRAGLLVVGPGGPSRLLLADASGHLSAATEVFPNHGFGLPGALAVAVADLDGDGKPDVVVVQGEGAFPAQLFLGDKLAPDTEPPVIAHVERVDRVKPHLVIRARVHDRKTPVQPFDFKQVVLRWHEGQGPVQELPMTWYGEALWRADLVNAAAPLTYQVCATDAAGNEACSDKVVVGT